MLLVTGTSWKFTKFHINNTTLQEQNRTKKQPITKPHSVFTNYLIFSLYSLNIENISLENLLYFLNNIQIHIQLKYYIYIYKHAILISS